MMHADYNLGLIMFASLFDDTAPKYTFDIGVPIHKEALTIVALPFHGKISAFKEKAGALFGTLVEECSKNNIEFSTMGHAVTKAKFVKISHNNSNSDSYKNTEMYLHSKIFAVINPEDAQFASSKLSEHFIVETLDTGNTLCATYQGDYEMLDHQYRMLFNNIQMRKYKRDKKRNYQSVEIYLNNPNEVPADELQTEIYIAIQ